MNVICGILRLDDQPICAQQLSQCHFQSPEWTPDHQAIQIQHNMGLICTQRFITPECSHAVMPYHHPASGCVVVADIFLTNRPALLTRLSLAKDCADVELLLAAYLKWGIDCTRYLHGPFMFAIWDAKKQTLLVASDHLSIRPCLYAYSPGKYFIFANHLAPFRKLCPSLTLNTTLFAHFALDSLPEGQTCYKEVNKILPAHQLIVTQHNLKQIPYWQLEKKSAPSYKTRDDYYQAFRELFATTVQQYLRSAYPITAQISGGLDSSAVACAAGKWLAQKKESLHTFTAIPQGLEGPSFRKGWYYHEMPRIEAVLQQYPNMQHTVYQGSALTDPLEEVSKFYPFIDQPFRNIFNFDWILACLKQAAKHNGRHILWGQRGNATISWAGRGIVQVLYGMYRDIRLRFNRSNLFDGYFSRHHADFLRSPQGREILQQRGSSIQDQSDLFNFAASRQTSIRPLSLWHGVEMLDPTGDIKLIEFCYSLPQWVYFRSRATLDRRLLVREGLVDILPENIRLNPYRGEQAADAYLQYNQHRSKWREKILQITDKKSDHLLWQLYDKQKMLGLFEEFNSICKPDREVQLQIYTNLTRCLSLGFFLEFLETT